MFLSIPNRTPLKRRLVSSLRPIAWLAPLLGCSFFTAYFLRFDGAVPLDSLELLGSILPAIVLLKTLAFLAVQMPLSCHAFVSLYDTYRLLRGSVFATACVASFDVFWLTEAQIPRGVIVIDGCLTALFVGGALTARRIVREHLQKRNASPTCPNVLIVGGPMAIELILRVITVDSEKRYQPVGILTDTQTMLHRSIGRTPVLGCLDDLERTLERVQCEKIMLSSGDLHGSQVRQIIALGESRGIDVCVVPDVSRIIDGTIDFRPRDVAIEDLLGRPTVNIDQTELSDWLSQKRVLVTGSCGSIGSELARQLLALRPQKLLLVDRNETGQFHLGRELVAAVEAGIVEIIIADVNDCLRMQSLFEQWQPHVVFHAAAYKHVPLMEQYPGEGVKNIVGTTKTLADLSDEFNVETFVLISTDKAVNPTSVMGCCKRIAELYVQSMTAQSACNFVTVRFGNVLDSAGSVIPIFREQIAMGGPVTVTHPEMIRYFMTIPEASQLVLQAAVMGQGGEVFVLDMGTPVKIRDLAEDMIRLSGLRVGHDIEITFTGIRQGEKLYEELYDHFEEQLATRHPKILRAVGQITPYTQLCPQIQHILETANAPHLWILEQLRILVPTFAPTHPHYFPRQLEPPTLFTKVVQQVS